MFSFCFAVKSLYLIGCKMPGVEEAIPLTDDIDKTFKPIFEQVMMIIFCMQDL